MYLVYYIILCKVYYNACVSQISPLKLLSQDKIGDFLNLAQYVVYISLMQNTVNYLSIISELFY